MQGQVKKSEKGECFYLFSKLVILAKPNLIIPNDNFV